MVQGVARRAIDAAAAALARRERLGQLARRLQMAAAVLACWLMLMLMTRS